MAKQTFHFPDITIVRDSLEAHISFQRPAEKLNRAYMSLHANISNSMQRYMPIRTGDFRRRTQTANNAMLGTGWVYAAVGPFGRMLYFGKVMVDEETGSPWARKGARKVVTDRPLNLTSGNPEATAEWFDTAKARHLQAWIDGVQKELDK